MSDERVGTEIAGYRIDSVLGQGGMGTVYVAEQTSPRRKVVLKLLRRDLSADDAFRRRFIHESEAAASTEHPNIVPIYSAGEADGVLYIAMRYVEGEDLRELIAQGRPLAARTRGRRSSRRSPPRSTRRTRVGSCIVTSSRATSCSTATATRTCRTSGSSSGARSTRA